MKVKTYADKLLENKDFREQFEQEYKNLLISEKIAYLRHRAHLTQEQLANRMHTTKSAISRYENNDYQGYSIPLLRKVASACGADLEVSFVLRKHQAESVAI